MKGSKNNEKEKEIKKEEKPIDTLKDNIKKENISDINIKNQSENEEIKILIDNDAKKEVKNNEKNNKNKKEEIIKKANRKPKFEPNYEYQIKDTMKKIKNKSLEKKMKDIFDSDKKNENIPENKFIDKLREIEVKIEEIDEYKKKKNNKFEFTLRNNNEEKNNRYDNYNKEKEKENNNFFNFNFSTKKSANKENKYKDLNKWYFSSDKFEFYNSPLETNKKKYQIMNIGEEMKKIYLKYNARRLRKMNNIIRNTTTPDNFKNILFKIDKFKKNKKENILQKKNLFNNKLAISEAKIIKYINNTSEFNKFKTLSVEKPSKLENMIENIYFEINKTNNIPLRNSFDNKLSNIKSKIKYSSITSEKNSLKIKSNNIFGKNRFTKSSFSNLDDLLKLCSKRNIKKYVYNSNMK